MSNAFVCRDGGINWVWYHWMVQESPTTVRITNSDRFHRWDESQGAHSHPDASFDVQFFDLKPLGEQWPEHHRQQKLELIATMRAKYGWPDTIIRFCHIYSGSNAPVVMGILPDQP
jgi:hypothetical protein